MNRIILMGFMGTGKSTTGRILAQKLGYEFLDLDKIIEEKEQRSIPEIFQKEGEAYFRRKEKEMARAVCQKDNTVIAVGGGTVVDPENKELLLSAGKLIALYADVDTILERTRGEGTRPVLDKAAEAGRREAIEHLLKERRDAYRGAHFSIDTSHISPLEVAEGILRFIKAGAEKHA